MYDIIVYIIKMGWRFSEIDFSAYFNNCNI